MQHFIFHMRNPVALKCFCKKWQLSVTKKCHKYTPRTNPQEQEEETQDSDSHIKIKRKISIVVKLQTPFVN